MRVETKTETVVKIILTEVERDLFEDELARLDLSDTPTLRKFFNEL